MLWGGVSGPICAVLLNEKTAMKLFSDIVLNGFLFITLMVFSSACEEIQPKSDLEKAIEAAARQRTPENFLALSLRYYEAGQYQKSLEAAQESLKLKPDYALAYNNICAAYNNLGDYDAGIKACQEALRIDPGFQLAKNNLAWALSARKSQPVK
jgi:tetratricopeptide (TPR) repeat protein